MNYNRNTGIRGLFAGPTFLTAVIAYTVAVLFNILAAFSPRASLLNSLASMAGYSGLNALNFGSSLSSVVNLLPSIYLAVSFWLIYSAAAGYSNAPGTMSVTGLKMVNVYLAVVKVLIYISMGASVLGVIAAMIGADSLLRYFRMSSGNVIVLLLVGLIFALAGLAFSVIIIIKAKQNCESMINAVLTGRMVNDITGFIPVLCFIVGGIYALDALRSLAYVSVTIIANAGNATAAIAFGLFVNQYRAVASGYGPAVPYQAPPAYGAPAYAPPSYAAPAYAAPTRRALLYSQTNGDNIEINTPNFVLGRNPSSCNYVIRNPGVSNVHATISNQGGAFYIRDENSTNHVYVGGQRIAPGTWVRLHNRSVVRLYNETFVFIHE